MSWISYSHIYVAITYVVIDVHGGFAHTDGMCSSPGVLLSLAVNHEDVVAVNTLDLGGMDIY